MTRQIRVESTSSQGLSRWLIGLAVVGVVGAGGITLTTVSRFKAPAVPSQPSVTAPVPTTVTALGRLEPAGELVTIAAPTSTEDNRIAELLVKEGDRVDKGQPIAVLASRDRLQAALEEAQRRVEVAQATVNQVRAGAKAGELGAQQATIARLEAERTGNLATQSATVDRLMSELRNAEVEYQRYQDLYTEGAISASQRDAKRLTLDTASQQVREAEAALERIRSTSEQQLSEARATYDRIAEVRPVDVAAAEAEVRSAQAAVSRAEANLAQAYIKAPQSGQILKIHARPGETVSTNGVVEIGKTSQMTAIAEVYESDVSQVKVGQRTTVSSNVFSGELQGTVEQVGWKVQRQNVVNTDPTSNTDARVVEVRIKLDPTSSQRAAKFTNLQVKAVIDVSKS